MYENRASTSTAQNDGSEKEIQNKPNISQKPRKLKKDKINKKIQDILSDFKISESELNTKVKNFCRKTVIRKRKSVISTKLHRININKIYLKKTDKVQNVLETSKLNENNNSKLKDCSNKTSNNLKHKLDVTDSKNNDTETNKNLVLIEVSGTQNESQNCTKDSKERFEEEKVSKSVELGVTTSHNKISKNAELSVDITQNESQKLKEAIEEENLPEMGELGEIIKETTNNSNVGKNSELSAIIPDLKEFEKENLPKIGELGDVVKQVINENKVDRNSELSVVSITLQNRAKDLKEALREEIVLKMGGLLEESKEAANKSKVDTNPERSEISLTQTANVTKVIIEDVPKMEELTKETKEVTRNDNKIDQYSVISVKTEMQYCLNDLKKAIKEDNESKITEPKKESDSKTNKKFENENLKNSQDISKELILEDISKINIKLLTSKTDDSGGLKASLIQNETQDNSKVLTKEVNKKFEGKNVSQTESQVKKEANTKYFETEEDLNLIEALNEMFHEENATKKQLETKSFVDEIVCEKVTNLKNSANITKTEGLDVLKQNTENLCESDVLKNTVTSKLKKTENFTDASGDSENVEHCVSVESKKLISENLLEYSENLKNIILKNLIQKSKDEKITGLVNVPEQISDSKNISNKLTEDSEDLKNISKDSKTSSFEEDFEKDINSSEEYKNISTEETMSTDSKTTEPTNLEKAQNTLENSIIGIGQGKISEKLGSEISKGVSNEMKSLENIPTPEEPKTSTEDLKISNNELDDHTNAFKKITDTPKMLELLEAPKIPSEEPKILKETPVPKEPAGPKIIEETPNIHKETAVGRKVLVEIFKVPKVPTRSPKVLIVSPKVCKELAGTPKVLKETSEVPRKLKEVLTETSTVPKEATKLLKALTDAHKVLKFSAEPSTALTETFKVPKKPIKAPKAPLETFKVPNESELASTIFIEAHKKITDSLDKLNMSSGTAKVPKEVPKELARTLTIPIVHAKALKVLKEAPKDFTNTSMMPKDSSGPLLSIEAPMKFTVASSALKESIQEYNRTIDSRNELLERFKVSSAPQEPKGAPNISIEAPKRITEPATTSIISPETPSKLENIPKIHVKSVQVLKNENYIKALDPEIVKKIEIFKKPMKTSNLVLNKIPKALSSSQMPKLLLPEEIKIIKKHPVMETTAFTGPEIESNYEQGSNSTTEPNFEMEPKTKLPMEKSGLNSLGPKISKPTYQKLMIKENPEHMKCELNKEPEILPSTFKPGLRTTESNSETAHKLPVPFKIEEENLDIEENDLHIEPEILNDMETGVSTEPNVKKTPKLQTIEELKIIETFTDTKECAQSDQKAPNSPKESLETSNMSPNLSNNSPTEVISATSTQDTYYTKTSPLLPFLPFVPNDEDFRCTIRSQLDLLKHVKHLPEPEPIASTSKGPEKKEQKLDNFHVNDVLSNEGDHLIVNVIGGYVSDEDNEEIEQETKQKKCITDILLSRDFAKEGNGTNKTNIETKEPSYLHEASPLLDSEPAKTSIDYSQPSTSKEPDLNLENSNSNSAFVSDVLDTFLTNHSELKISYEVPKLKAEDAISKPTSELPVLNTTPPEQPAPKPKKSKKDQLIKPKTLAEKRKLLELERQSQLQQTIETTETQYRKQFEKNKSVVKNVRNQLLKGNIPISKPCWYMATNYGQECKSYVIINDQKVRLAGSFGAENLIFKQKNFKKNSGIKNVYPNIKKVEYRPGPLSKKHKLVKNCNNCEYEVKKLPKIKLVIFPKLGKKLPLIAEQYLHLCKDERGFISDELAQFAASAILTAKPTKTKIEFDIPYANHQNKILLRRITKKESTRVKKYDNIDTEISNVVSGLLDAIDNQGLDDLIIKDDPDLSELNQIDNTSRPPSPINPLMQTLIRKRNYKKNRTTLELRRLNVQVIEVDVAEEKITNHDDRCNKEYCRMGCVCKSLMGLSNNMPEHCGREACMFECTCTLLQQNNHHSVTLPAGTDLLSTSTMVRLQDEAVKHLAKVEKEFTQTVIKANNQTIVVGGGARDRQRRVPKLPKKYTDYVNIADELANLQDMPEEIKQTNETTPVKKLVPIWKSPDPKELIKHCYVRVDKLNIDTSNILPWCMVHNLYKCYCGGKPEPKPQPIEIKTEKLDKDDSEYITYEPRYAPRKQKEFKLESDEKPKETDVYTPRFRTQKRLSEERDNDLLIVRKKTKKQIMTTDESFSIFAQKTTPEKTQDQSTSQSTSQTPEITTENSTITPQNPGYPKDRVKIANLIDYEKSYIGLLIPTASWVQEFQKMLNMTNVKVHHIRLLNWGILVDRYRKGTLNLWLNTKRNYNNVVLTESKDRPSRFHINVQAFEKGQPVVKVPDIVNSILNNKLPGNATNEEETFVILVYFGLDWEARASIVLKNTSEQVKLKLQYKPTPFYVLCKDEKFIFMPELGSTGRKNTEKEVFSLSEQSKPKEKPFILPKEKSPTQTDPKINHLKKNMRGVEITKVPNKDKSTNLTPVLTTAEATKNILASLPAVKGNKSRWFMIKLEDDFSVLRIQSNNFHIKYTHLSAAIIMARRNRKTVRIRSQEKDSQQPAKIGIYAVPDFHDRIFFGPYGPNEDHGLETFRYINSQLINTKTYDTMRGQEHKPIGFWFTQSMNNLIFEASQNSETVTEMVNPENAVKPQIEFVDLTENDSDEEVETPKKQTVDPLYNVLAADFTKRLSSDLTIERIKDDGNSTQPVDVKKILNKEQTPLKQTELPKGPKRKFTPTKKLPERKSTEIIPPRKSIELKKLPDTPPVEIDVIDLDDDEEPNAKKKKMPQLMPIDKFKEKVVSPKMTSILKPAYTQLYLTSKVPGIGFIEVLKCDTSYYLPGFCVEGVTVPKYFHDVKNVIDWLETFLKEHIYHIPSDLSLNLTEWPKKTAPTCMAPFDLKLINGFHMVCSRGVYNVMGMSRAEIEKLGFTTDVTAEILAHKCKILIKKNIYIIGTFLLGDEAKQLSDSKIVDLAPQKIKELEKETESLTELKKQLLTNQKDMLTRANTLMQEVPVGIKRKVTRNVGNILCKNYKGVTKVDEVKTIPNPSPQNRTLLTTVNKPEQIVISELPKKKTVKTDEKNDQSGFMKFKLVNGCFLMPVPSANNGTSKNSTATSTVTQIVDLTDS